MMKKIIAFFYLALILNVAYGQSNFDNSFIGRWTLAAGLTQPVLLGGVNMGGTYFAKKLTFEYSHGMFLHLNGSALKDKKVKSIYVPFSTGFGMGYRFTQFFDIRGEVKVHRFEPQLNSYQKISYINFDLGVGAYYRIYPFRKKENWTREILIEPSIRYWHDMYSSLTDGKFEYVNDEGENLTHYPYSLPTFQSDIHF